MTPKLRTLISALAITVIAASAVAAQSVVERTAKSTITPVELDHGDELHFTLRNGETRVLRLEDSGADILLSNVYPANLMQERIDHGIMYQIWIDISIDGHPMRLTRYLCSQASFNEPYVVNGMRIWLCYIRAPSGVFMRGPVGPNPSNRGGYPRKEARIVVNDLTDRICPQVMEPWYRDSETLPGKEFANLRIDARDTYKGDDMHMGGYWGATPHRGLDINMRAGTQLIAPIDFDSHELPSGSSAWRGYRDWGNGSRWEMRAHHTIRTVVTEHVPLARGTYYADAAGIAVGEAEHAHFELWVTEHGLIYWLDPWMAFWQMFRDLLDAEGAIHAEMVPVSPATAGTPVSFSSAGSRAGAGDDLRYSWTFGDGGSSTEPDPAYTYLNPGIYAVTLTVCDGEQKADFVQNITVDGTSVAKPGVALFAADEVEFLPWPVNATRVYGEAPVFLPHTLRFTARESRPAPSEKQVALVNTGQGTLAAAAVSVDYFAEDDWCHVVIGGEGNEQSLRVSVDATGLAPGFYEAHVEVNVAGALNGNQRFRVWLQVEAEDPPHRQIIVKNTDPWFYATPWFWVSHSFHVNYTDSNWGGAGRWDRPKLPPALLTHDNRNRMGLTGLYLSNGHRAEAGQFFRFTPDLAAGEYEVSTPRETPWDSTTEVDVRVRHAGGDTMVRYHPGEDPVIGVFEFDEGRDGFVEFYAEASAGQVSADAVIFLNTDYAVKLVVDNADDEVETVGTWIASTVEPGYFGDDYMHDGNVDKGEKSFRFIPRILSGEHEVWLHWPAGANHATNVPVVIRTAEGETEVTVNQRESGGDWHLLGSYMLSADEVWVEIRTEGTDGYVVADAVRLVSEDDFADPTGLIARWKFDDYQGSGILTTAVDSVGGREMTLHNVAGDANTWIPGKVGEYALKFDGSDDYATVGAINLPPMHPRTITGWVRMDSVSQPSWGLIFGFVGPTGATSFLVGFPAGGGRVIVDLNNYQYTLMATMSTEWHHMAVTWDGTTVTGYLDGQVSFSTASPYGLAVEDDFRLARIWNNFNGAVDDLRIYERALEANEIEALFRYKPGQELPEWQLELEEMLRGPVFAEGPWYRTPIGLMHVEELPLVEHRDLGWIYLYPSNGDLWLYSARHGWLWTRPGETFPVLLRLADNRWFQVMHPLDEGGWMFDFNNRQWLNWNN